MLAKRNQEDRREICQCDQNSIQRENSPPVAIEEAGESKDATRAKCRGCQRQDQGRSAAVRWQHSCPPRKDNQKDPSAPDARCRKAEYRRHRMPGLRNGQPGIGEGSSGHKSNLARDCLDRRASRHSSCPRTSPEKLLLFVLIELDVEVNLGQRDLRRDRCELERVRNVAKNAHDPCFIRLAHIALNEGLILSDQYIFLQ
ncbi:MAG: hypothetical protein JWN24_4526 [Phycisphaerales bacterium]|jgi:hypothetical protein|nr:hypothetical protein [Phycisphaerales bacterium]